jgi:hypothetical protein
MKKVALIALMSFALSGCTVFKSRLIPQAYMPDPPAVLMEEPKKLHTIKKGPEAQKNEEQK